MTMAEGWKCPCCGRGVAPHVATCDHGDRRQSAAPPVSPGGRPLDAVAPRTPDTGKIDIGPFVVPSVFPDPHDARMQRFRMNDWFQHGLPTTMPWRSGTVD